MRPTPSSARSHRTVVLLVTPIAILTIVGLVTSAIWPALAARHPLLLIVLDSRNRYLILARHVDPVLFVVVGTLRRMLSDPLYFVLGRLYGERAIRWLEKEGGGGALVRVTEQLFAKTAYPMVFLFPGAVPCALAGATNMGVVPFALLNLTGTVTVVVLLRLFGDVFAGPVDSVLGFFNRHLLVTTLVTVALTALSVVVARVQGRSEVPSVEDLEVTLEATPEAAGEDPDRRAGGGRVVEPPG